MNSVIYLLCFSRTALLAGSHQGHGKGLPKVAKQGCHFVQDEFALDEMPPCQCLILWKVWQRIHPKAAPFLCCADGIPSRYCFCGSSDEPFLFMELCQKLAYQVRTFD